MNKKAYHKGIQHRGSWQSRAESWAVLAKKPVVARKPVEGGMDSRVRSFDSHLAGIIICHNSAADGRRASRSVPVKGGGYYWWTSSRELYPLDQCLFCARDVGNRNLEEGFPSFIPTPEGGGLTGVSFLLRFLVGIPTTKGILKLQ